MPFKFNPLSRKFDYYEVSSGGSGAGTGLGWADEVASYAALPDASLHSGEVYLVQAASGIWPLRKKAGLWRAAGGSWTYLGAATLTALADVPTIPDSINNYALVSEEGVLSWVDMTTIIGNMTAAQIVQALQTAYPRLTWLHSGNSVDGAPDSTTAAAISAFLTATGVASDYVDFLDLGEAVAGSTFVIADATSGSAADNVVLALGGGTFTIQDATSASTADNVTITDASILAFVIQDAASASTADNVVLALGGGTFAIADVSSGSTADNITLVFGGGTFAIADATSASTADNVVLEAGASAPATPTQSAIVAGDTQISVNWADVSGETSYTVYYSDNSGLTATTRDGSNAYDAQTSRSGKITGISANAVNRIITGLTNGTTYYTKVSASNGAGESALSSVQSGTPFLWTTFETLNFNGVSDVNTYLSGAGWTSYGAGAYSSVNSDFYHTAAPSLIVTREFGSGAGTVETLLSKSVAYKGGVTGEAWVLIGSDHTSVANNFQVYLDSTLLAQATVSVGDGILVRVPFTLPPGDGTGVLSLRTKRQAWSDGGENSGVDISIVLDDIKVPIQ